ncbi:RutC family protein [Planococcus massiliensis]|uniref:RutC family protein n=1 Tax=Planococcus massiliensis TaxID=1499687 RepID=A0A098EH08_9BACL|nr:RidA family protein [Planococcus massiliensis]CEG21553.1 RutC family protein [Planococcus massiliensis]
MANDKITRKNPAGVPEPVGNYTHITKIPRNAELYVTSGQIGLDENGKLPDSLNRQITYTFQNIRAVLESEQLSAADIIKVNIWATEKIDWDFMYSEWSAMFGDDDPAMTIGYIKELGWPEIKVEIEIWAAKV